MTQCLGLDDAPEPHVVTGEVAEGDTYMLCTDGLVGIVQDKRGTVSLLFLVI